MELAGLESNWCQFLANRIEVPMSPKPADERSNHDVSGRRGRPLAAELRDTSARAANRLMLVTNCEAADGVGHCR
jgi:hypothetical protein